VVTYEGVPSLHAHDEFMCLVVLLLWVFVVYNRNLWVLAFMGILLLDEVAAVAAILAMSFSNFHAEANLIPGIVFCLVVHEPSFFHIVWSPILAYRAILFALFLAKGCMVYRQGRAWKSTGLLETIYQNFLIDFLAIFAAYLSCAVMWLAADPYLAQVPMGFALSLSITSCTRLLLNIRDAYYAQAEGDLHRKSTRQTLGTISIGTSADFWTEEGSKLVRAPSIYAEYKSQDLWAFDLREMKWSGNLDN